MFLKGMDTLMAGRRSTWRPPSVSHLFSGYQSMYRILPWEILFWGPSSQKLFGLDTDKLIKLPDFRFKPKTKSL